MEVKVDFEGIEKVFDKNLYAIGKSKQDGFLRTRSDNPSRQLPSDCGRLATRYPPALNARSLYLDGLVESRYPSLAVSRPSHTRTRVPNQRGAPPKGGAIQIQGGSSKERLGKSAPERPAAVDPLKRMSILGRVVIYF
ncbi:hypothetical protein EVAR_9683_1 [Eumeta japonica]|uniref:Uncharacterized protein n=1 Tax=Eumeta variegata TaxID=151549 RepID=A0A4C1YD19_EUMVA|nr:hypothetical protein EVAR_9683_1 [Eumeta japonica]